MGDCAHVVQLPGRATHVLVEQMLELFGRRIHRAAQLDIAVTLAALAAVCVLGIHFLALVWQTVTLQIDKPALRTAVGRLIVAFLVQTQLLKVNLVIGAAKGQLGIEVVIVVIKVVIIFI